MSVASTNSGVAGYDPTTKAASTQTNRSWKSTLGAVSVGNGTDTRQITNVAAGTQDTDAVNVAQLKAAVAGASSGGATHIGAIIGDSYYNAANGTLNPNGSNALSTYDVAGQTATPGQNIITTIKNMNEGGIRYFHTQDDSGQTTGGTLGQTGDSSASGSFATAIGVGAVASGAHSLAIGNASVIARGAGGAVTLREEERARASAEGAIAIGKGATASGVQSISIGTGNQVTGARSGAIGDPNHVAGAGSYAYGNDNTIDANNAFVLGNNVRIAAGSEGAVALGHGSTVDAAHTGPYSPGGAADAQVAGSKGAGTQVVSVGSAGHERQIQNLAPGVVDATSTDAINGSQLYQMQQHMGAIHQGVQALTGHINEVERDASAGTASALASAGLPQTWLPGKSMVAASASTWRGASALAVGVSTITDNGKWVFKGSLNANTRGHMGASLGAGYMWQ